MKSMDHRNCLMKIMACHLPCRHLHPLLPLSTRLTPRQLQLPKHQQQLPSLRHIRLEFFLQHRQSWSLLLMFHQSQCHPHLWGSLLIFHQPQCHHHLWGTLLIQHRPQSHLNQSRLVSRLTQQKSIRTTTQAQAVSETAKEDRRMTLCHLTSLFQLSERQLTIESSTSGHSSPKSRSWRRPSASRNSELRKSSSKLANKWLKGFNKTT